MAKGHHNLKQRFITAMLNGDLGTTDDRGTVVTLKEFKAYFPDVTTQYVSSFLPAVTIEKGRYAMTNTRFLFRIHKGVYMLHPDLHSLDDLPASCKQTGASIDIEDNSKAEGAES